MGVLVGVLHNSLPSKVELKRRHVAMESLCEFCGNLEETLYHMVFDCPVVKRFWSEVNKSSGMTDPLIHPST